MTRRAIALFLLIAAASSLTFSQGWQWFRTVTPKKQVDGAHGIAVDKQGKIWVAPHRRTDSVGTVFTCALYCYYPDGTQPAFSPVKIFAGPGFTDTLGDNRNRGITTDTSGNVVGTWFNILYRINSQTGAGMNKVVFNSENASGTGPGVDSLNETFVGTRVVPAGSGSPIKIYANNFAPLGNAFDTVKVIARSLAVSKSGNDIFYGNLSQKRVDIYHSDFGSFGPYALTDSTLIGGAPECFGFQPRTGWLWISAGNIDNDPPRVGTRWRPQTWYAFDPVTRVVRDSISIDTMQVPTGLGYRCRPRGIAFSPRRAGAQYDTAYIAIFNIDTAYVQMLRRVITSVEQVDNNIPTGYDLSQNYPNPFNPTTEIRFTIPASGMTTVKVYDLLGREVATLVNEELTAGSYKTKFDATELSSGTYVYRLVSNGYGISKKMLLVK